MTTGIEREARIAASFLPMVRAYILARVDEYSLTPAAVCLVLSELRRECVDRRADLGAALMADLERPDPPNPRNVQPARRRDGQ